MDGWPDINVAERAARMGKVGCLEVALKHGSKGDGFGAMRAAIAEGHMACVIFLCQQGEVVVTTELLCYAVRQQQLECAWVLAGVLLDKCKQDSSLAGQFTEMIGHRTFHHAQLAGFCCTLANQGEVQVLQTLAECGCRDFLEGDVLTEAVRGALTGRKPLVSLWYVSQPPTPPPGCPTTSPGITTALPRTTRGIVQ